MKKVLILWASEKSSPGSPEYYTKHEATAATIRILEALSIPFDTGWSAVVPTSDAAKYALVIIPEMRNNMPSLYPWAGGALATPVLVVNASWVENWVSRSWFSGATAQSSQATAASFETSWGGLIGYTGYIYTMDATDAGVTKLMYNDAGKCAFWKRRGAAGDVYFWANAGGAALPLTHVLAQVYTAGEVLYPIFPNIDHSAEADIDKLTDCISWFRARGAVCAVGERTEYWPNISASMKALLRDNQDVLIPQVHTHSATPLFSDDVTYPTVAAKVAQYRIERAILEADGINTADNGSLGFQFLASNLVSVLGTEAMANLGITAWRACNSGHPWASSLSLNNPVTLHKVGGEVLRVVGRASAGTTLWTASTLAAEWAHKGASDIHGYRSQLQLIRWTRQIFRWNAPILYIHGVNNLQGENPGQMFFDVWDAVVKAGSPIIRWSTREDLANMAGLYGRRAPGR